MKQSMFLLSLLLSLSLTDCKKGSDAPTSLPDINISWTAVDSGLTTTNVRAIAVSGANLFAGTTGGIFLSTNNGTSWSQITAGLTNTNVNAIAASGPNLFAVTFGGGVFVSSNN